MTTVNTSTHRAAAGQPETRNPSGPNKVFVRKDPQLWKRRGWTSSPNSIIHARDMPPAEIWAWIWLASHSSTFELNAKALADANKHVGRDKAYKLIAALEERGLLLRVYERSATGVPYMVYELQPEPVPAEQRTAKPKRSKSPRKSAFSKDAVTTAAMQASPDSCTVRNPGVTSQNSPSPETEAGQPGFLHGQESGRDQPEQPIAGDDTGAGKGTLIPARAVPARAGESYKEDKTKEQNQPTNVGEPGGGDAGSRPRPGWLEDQHADEDRTEVCDAAPASSMPDPDGVRILRGLPHGVGPALAEHAVHAWSEIVAAALAAGVDESVIVDKLASGLPDQDVQRRVRIVVGRRLPDLQALTLSRQTPRNGAEGSAEARAHADVTKMADQGRFGAQRAAGLLGEAWDPQRGDLDARTWLLERQPQLASEYVEARRERLVQVLACTGAARS